MKAMGHEVSIPAMHCSWLEGKIDRHWDNYAGLHVYDLEILKSGSRFCVRGSWSDVLACRVDGSDCGHPSYQAGTRLRHEQEGSAGGLEAGKQVRRRALQLRSVLHTHACITCVSCSSGTLACQCAHDDASTESHIMMSS